VFTRDWKIDLNDFTSNRPEGEINCRCYKNYRTKHCNLLLSCIGLAWDPELLYVASIAATLLFVRQGEIFKPFGTVCVAESSVVDPIRWIHMFLGLLDPEPDPLVRGTVPDPDPSIIK
jgi:hypothetical protein